MPKGDGRQQEFVFQQWVNSIAEISIAYSAQTASAYRLSPVLQLAISDKVTRILMFALKLVLWL
jgi:hypothetical protein